MHSMYSVLGFTQMSWTFSFKDLFTYWFVDPKDVSTVCQCFIWPKVGHRLSLDPRALLPLEHAWARCAIERVDLKDKSKSTTHANLNDISNKAQNLFVAIRIVCWHCFVQATWKDAMFYWIAISLFAI